MKVRFKRKQRRIAWKKLAYWFVFLAATFVFIVMAVTACQAEEQMLKEAGAETIAYLTSVETEKRMEADKVEESVVSETEITTEESKEETEEVATTKDETEELVKFYYDVPLAYELQDYIIRLCEEHHIDSAVVIAMIKRESGFQADAIGDGGNSLGLMQIQPRWHSGRMDKLSCTNLLDPMQNVKVGIDLLAELIDSYGGDVGKALTAYNQGYCNGYISNYATTVLATSEYLKEGMIEVPYLPDAYDMWEAHDAQQQKELEELPVCYYCDQPIQDDHYYTIHDENICPDCLESYFRKEMY